MTITPGFTLCFLVNKDQILMLHRRFPPNQGLWNGVGGHIEPGETPRQAVIREVSEETGYHIADPQFAGLITWEGFEIPPGGIAIFTAEVPHRTFITNHEGELAWMPKEWACSAPEVVDNIHVFLPKILAGEKPQHYHFSYLEGKRVADRISDLPEDFDPDQLNQPHEAFIEEQRGDYLLSNDRGRLQVDLIENYLSMRSYWAEGRPREIIERSIQHSVCLGIYKHGLQVAFARLVTDEATFAWLDDVYVEEAERGQGLGKWLLEAACQYIDRCGIQQSVLMTDDAQTLYETYGGFKPLSDPEKWMSRQTPGSE